MPEVVVVGAGVAGLTAARELSAAGADVLVVEARDHIGGRTHTVDLGGGTVDLGGAWVHDPDHNPLTGYLESHGIAMRSDGMWGQGMKAYTSDGWLSPEETSTVVAALYNFDPVSASAAVTTDRFGDAIEWYGRTQLSNASQRARVDGFLHRVMAAGITGDEAGDISLEGMAAFEGEESGHNSVVVGGYRVLVEHLSPELQIEVSSPVSEVRHSTSGVSVVVEERVIEADWAVVTVPLGVLKAGSIDFAPALPAGHLDAIARLKVKSLEKVFLTFHERFWGESLTQIALLDHDAGFVWVHDLTLHSGVPTLVAFYNPAIASNDVTGPEAGEAFTSLLADMFGDVPEASQVATTAWASDPYSLGAYSFIPVGASADDMQSLAEPIGSRVLLAGEHTYPAYYGTVQAAWLSGKRAAGVIND